MEDLISRQAAIDAIVNCTNCGDEKTLRAYVVKHNLDNGWTGGVLEAIDAIEDLPSAQLERKKGKWVQDDIASNVFRCSECGCDAPVDPTAGCEIKSNFCQWCGADMGGEQDG